MFSPRESKDRRNFWLLIATIYGLLNKNETFQNQSDDLIHWIGVNHMSVIPRLFYLIKNGKLLIIVIKIVDDLLMAGETDSLQDFISRFNGSFELGTVIDGILKFFGLTIIKNEDFSYVIHGDEKLNYIECFHSLELSAKKMILH